MRKIVLGYDGSKSADRALVRAAEFADIGTEITVISVVHPLAGKGGFAYDPVEEEEHAKDLEIARERLAALGRTGTFVTGHGDPAREIATEAHDSGADMIVVGSEHKGLLERLLFGSVSTDVVQRAEVDVLVVP